MSRGKPSNQELRTRKDLLEAARRLTKQGQMPTMDEVAKEALVSRATAYRYFRSVEALVAESAVDALVEDPRRFFDDDTSEDPEERVDRAEAFLHRVTYENEAQLRVMLANALVPSSEPGAAPRRQNRRLPLIEAALAPARGQLREVDYRRLCAALSVFFGPEAMVVFKDVLGLEEKSARRVKSWAVRALVRAALPAKSLSAVPPAASSIQ